MVSDSFNTDPKKENFTITSELGASLGCVQCEAVALILIAAELEMLLFLFALVGVFDEKIILSTSLILDEQAVHVNPVICQVQYTHDHECTHTVHTYRLWSNITLVTQKNPAFTGKLSLLSSV